MESGYKYNVEIWEIRKSLFCEAIPEADANAGLAENF